MIHLRGLNGRAVEDVGRVDAEASEDPGEGKARKQSVASLLIVRVLAHLGSLKIKYDIYSETRL